MLPHEDAYSLGQTK